ncbi:hypothetical protein LTR56_000103 [Elasticomyces elasticus]|nr:hypothetical protein LTR56_000103 [Elasticomyces elasticus]KAK3667091.1 hypothetical protein LTR22_001955 [Elasticomyces elasticus]KAK4932866.1 hypothetical protein LTR49_000822 [Elasticomyces elasticus]KAK5768730.1 hypothetical protein LTS12_001156 [Elasticomyces elasticus]
MTSAAQDTATANAANDQDSGPQDHEIFPLFELPPELWVRIVRLAVIHTKPFTISEGLTTREFQDRVAQAAITRVCWAVRNETLSTFYANTFRYVDIAGTTRSFRRWLQRFSFGQGHKMPNLIIESPEDDVMEYFSEWLPELQLELQVTRKRSFKIEDAEDWVDYKEGDGTEIVTYKIKPLAVSWTMAGEDEDT